MHTVLFLLNLSLCGCVPWCRNRAGIPKAKTWLHRIINLISKKPRQTKVFKGRLSDLVYYRIPLRPACYRSDLLL